MKGQTATPSASEIELGTAAVPPVEEEQVEPGPAPEQGHLRKGLEIKPLPLVLTILALALLLLIPSLLLLQRLQS